MSKPINLTFDGLITPKPKLVVQETIQDSAQKSNIVNNYDYYSNESTSKSDNQEKVTSELTLEQSKESLAEIEIKEGGVFILNPKSPNSVDRSNKTDNYLSLQSEPGQSKTQSQLFDHHSMFGFVNNLQRHERTQNYRGSFWKTLSNLTKNRTQEGSIVINISPIDKLFFAWRNLSKSNIVIIVTFVIVVVGLGVLFLNQFRLASASPFNFITIRYK